MSGGTMGPYTANSPIDAPQSRTGGPSDQRQPPTVQEGQDRTQAPQRQGLRAHPMQVLAGALILISVVLGAAGIGYSLGRSGATDIQQTTISVISTVNPSVVQVQASNGRTLGGSVGSGEILTSNGYIVTNSHVVHGLSTLNTLLSNGQTVPAQLVADIPNEDLAVLKIAANNLKPIAIADSSQLQVGDFTIAMGSPLGLEQSATTGIVSALNRSGTEVVDGNTFTLNGMIQTSAPINPGNSGGALINLQGQLVGIPTLSAVEPATMVAANGIGFAISSNTMESVIAPYVPSGS